MWLNEYFGFEIQIRNTHLVTNYLKADPLDNECHADEFAVSCIEIDGFCQECPYLLPALYVSLCALNCEGIRDYVPRVAGITVLTVTYFNFDADYLTGRFLHKMAYEGIFFTVHKTKRASRSNFLISSQTFHDPSQKLITSKKKFHFQRVICGSKVQTISGIH